MSPRKGPLVVTAGDPAGIGPDICLDIAARRRGEVPEFTVVGDEASLRERAEKLGLPFELDVINLPFPAPIEAGHPDPRNSAALLDGLKLAVEGCRDDRFSAMVTAPLAKHVIAESGVAFSGHTEYLAELTGAPLPVMLLVAGELRVALATTHIPLHEVPGAVTREGLSAVIEVLHSGLETRFGISDPAIVVCGLNPHAGEQGQLGSEDRDVIAPVIDELRGRGMALRGPVPADTAFLATEERKDAVLAMYHDQGLPVLKYAGFGGGVNVTLGLPIVRTSVDHGTAFDLAGTGRASSDSLVAAMKLAAELQ
ncbi:MAG: 4-hydroxythreonine-4-phosphate dehydrogenase PdxA [Woeseiaceae bacterium]|nr:4-hydroxythreonine-4-phosphate dehydrogenase PdxA [Woeseiaceae bacterium]